VEAGKNNHGGLHMTRDEAMELIDRMPYIPTITENNRKLRLELYKLSSISDDPSEWVKVIKSCYVQTHFVDKMNISEEELQYGHTAKKRLEAELSQAIGIKEEDIEEYINTYIDKNL
jgi:CarD family transcriptional regulator